MTNARHWLLPLLLGAAQLAAWPGLPLLSGDPVDPVTGVITVVVTVVVVAALCFRRSAPIVVTAVIVVAVTPAVWAVPGDETTVIALADLIALYSVAVHRPGRQAAAVAAVLTGWQTVLTTLDDGVDIELPLTLLLVAAVYLLTVTLGRARRRWHADRATAARRLAEAEDRRRRSADTERHRLARELHDVTAHHLTSIVVTASAAQRLAGRRPDLTADALEFAGRTGRETLAALHRLVAVMRTPDEQPASPAEQLEELADGFRRLGQVVSVDAAPDALPPPVADAVHGIAREALTNTLRYAPGSAVRLRLSAGADGVEFVVDDDGSTTAAGAGGPAGLGSGRGVQGMRERAAAVGGVLQAGARPDGGWRVRAALPAYGGARPAAARWRPTSEHGTDVGVALLTLLVPATALLIAAEEGDLPFAPVGALVVAVTAAQVLPLLLRRRRPWIALGTALGACWVWPLLVAAGAVPADVMWFALTGFGAVLAAVYAAAAHGGSPALTWLAPLAATVGTGALCGLLIVIEGDLDPQPHGAEVVLAFGIMATMFGALTSIPAFLTWTAGVTVRHRRVALLAREGGALAVATADAVAAARAERIRVAAGLREAVLHRTAHVATAADGGDLDAVLASARGALAAMRGLLTGLRDTPDGERAPQPGVAALGVLCEQARQAGRGVSLIVTGTAAPLPADADVSAYRMVELILAAGTGPVAVRGDYGAGRLRIVVSPMPPDPDGALAAGLRARATAAGGSISVDGTGADVRLPTVEEVASSPSV